MTEIDRRLEELGIDPIGPGFVPATPSEVAEIERRLGRSLPEDYKRFLESYGYAGFDGVVSVALPDSSDEVPVMVFFGGGAGGEPVLEEFEINEEKFRRGMLPIASDPFGNLFLLEVDGSTSGTVWYADFDRQVPTTSTGDPVGKWNFGIVPVAETFVDFLNQLVAEEL